MGHDDRRDRVQEDTGGTGGTREDTRYGRFGTVRPRVQIPGPRPKFEYDPGVTVGAGRSPYHSRITISRDFPGRQTCRTGRHRRRVGAALAVSDGHGGVGYLLKDSAADLDELVNAVRRVGEGGSVFDPAVVARLLGRRRSASALDDLSDRERAVSIANGRRALEGCNRDQAVFGGADGGVARSQYLWKARTGRHRRRSPEGPGCRHLPAFVATLQPLTIQAALNGY